MSEKPEVGKLAPKVTAPLVGGGYGEDTQVSLSGLRGEKVVLSEVKPAEHVDKLLEILA